MTSPIWQKTSLASPRSACAPSAPRIASGTASRTMNGSAKLSYCAASVRNTTRSPSPKMSSDWLPDSISSQRQARPLDSEARGQHLLGQLLHRPDRLARAVSRRRPRR